MRKQGFELIVANLLRDCTADSAPVIESRAPAPPIACTPTATPPIDLVEFFGSLSQAESASWGRILSSTQAAHAISAHYGLDFDDVRRVMNEMSMSLWCLLDSAEGWTVLGEQVAIALKGTPTVPLFKSSIH